MTRKLTTTHITARLTLTHVDGPKLDETDEGTLVDEVVDNFPTEVWIDDAHYEVTSDVIR